MLEDVSFEISRGATLGLVGPSGCGKSTLALCVLDLLRPDAGEVLFDDKRVAVLEGETRRQFRRDAQIIFQDAYGSLDPRMSVNQIVAEPLRIHRRYRGQEMGRQIAEILHVVGLNEGYLNRKPSEMSGGQQQRVAIARALILRPRLLICDEPTASLDLPAQAQILNLLRRLQDEFGMTYLLISHNIRVVQTMTDTVVEMRAGRIRQLDRALGTGT